MRRKKKKAALGAVFFYLLLSGGLWMFINSYSNSSNRLSGDNITPAMLELNGGRASIGLLERNAEIDLSCMLPDSKAYCGAYLCSPDEVRAAAYLIALCI
ncbi:MAG: hypothetical protein IKH78_02815 [Ruminococcus sp.]|nr:hypothetical protein [Ruminococcus sp.]